MRPHHGGTWLVQISFSPSSTAVPTISKINSLPNRTTSPSLSPRFVRGPQSFWRWWLLLPLLLLVTCSTPGPFSRVSALPLSSPGLPSTLPAPGAGAVLIPLRRLTPTASQVQLHHHRSRLAHDHNPRNNEFIQSDDDDDDDDDSSPSMTLLKRRRAVNNPSQLNRRQDDSSSSALSSTTLKNGLISVTTLGRVGYAGHVLIGNPPQRISVLFDTGSDLALVISDQCKGQECADLVQFSCLKSTTCIELGEDMTKSAGGKVAIATGDNATSSNSSSGVPQLEGQVGGNSTSHSINSRSSDSKVQQPAGPSVVKIEEGPWSLDPKDNDMHHQDAEPAPSMTRGRVSAVAGVNLSTGVGSGADANFYNQTYVDGSWGAGTFVQDRIQIDTTPPGQVFINNNSVVENNQAIRSPHSDIKVPSPSSGKSFSPSSSSSSTGHGAAVTFLDVVEDNLGLVQGYDGQISGLLGLTRASPTGRKTFLQELVEQGSLAQPIISMHLEWEGGSFLLGGIDHSQYVGELIYSPVTDPVSWQISLQGLGTRSRNRTASAAIDVGKGGKGQVGEAIGARVGPGIGKQQISGHTYDSNNAEIRMLPQQSVFQDASLVLDSGTSSILIPTAASEAIHAELFGTWDPIHRAWFLPCEGPDLIWWISSGHGIVQPHESLVYKLEDGRCQSLIFEDQDADYWILGDTWLRGLYLVYDMEGSGRIGIANAIGSEGSKASKDECQTDDRVRILTVKENGVGMAHSLLSYCGRVPRAASITGWMMLSHWVFEMLL